LLKRHGKPQSNLKALAFGLLLGALMLAAILVYGWSR
jgi:hypothetical protein